MGIPKKHRGPVVFESVDITDNKALYEFGLKREGNRIVVDDNKRRVIHEFEPGEEGFVAPKKRASKKK